MRQRLRTLILGGAVVVLLSAGAGAGLTYAATRGAPVLRTGTTEDAQVQPDQGVLIAHVEQDGPAAAAGIKRGDILLKVADRAVNTPREVEEALRDRQPGDSVQVTVQHGDATLTPTVTLGDRGGQPFLGIVPCGSGHDRLVMRAGIEGPGGVIVRVEPDSPAARAGLAPGDQVVSVDGQRLDPEHRLADLIGGHKPGDRVTLEVTRPGEEARQVAVELGQHPHDVTKAYLGVSVVGGSGFGLIKRLGE
ncbi:MAG TPA: PDZ domain-containing protein, partial [Dehalococcoidia bacterium]|nr:PDZ domain-containing protein [Dehalococcoidia bacterium]